MCQSRVFLPESQHQPTGKHQRKHHCNEPEAQQLCHYQFCTNARHHPKEMNAHEGCCVRGHERLGFFSNGNCSCESDQQTEPKDIIFPRGATTRTSHDIRKANSDKRERKRVIHRSPRCPTSKHQEGRIFEYRSSSMSWKTLRRRKGNEDFLLECSSRAR